MIVACPKCNTKYKVKDDLISPEGTKLKCSKCGHIFVYPEKEGDTSDNKLKTKEEKKEVESQGDELSPKKFSLEEPVIKKDSKISKKLIIVLAVIFLLTGTTIGIFYLFPSLTEKIPFLHKTKIKQVTPSNSTSIASVKKIDLEEIKQYFVKNDKIGNILVIEGRAVNKFDKPKELIKVQASLFDKKGNLLAKKVVLCGNKVSLFQLQSWSREHLEKELSSKVGILMKNTNIPPGGGVDFMILFFNPPEGVSEYGLQVVQAMDVEQKK